MPHTLTEVSLSKAGRESCCSGSTHHVQALVREEVSFDMQIFGQTEART